MLDEVDVITGVSGGSFTALAYGLYGEKLFNQYEARFLKRNVQGELMARFLNPLNWGALVVDWLGPFRASGTAIRRHSVQPGHVRRPLSRGWADDRGELRPTLRPDRVLTLCRKISMSCVRILDRSDYRAPLRHRQQCRSCCRL